MQPVQTQGTQKRPRGFFTRLWQHLRLRQRLVRLREWLAGALEKLAESG